MRFRQMFLDFSLWGSNVLIFFKIWGSAVLNLFLISSKSEAHCSYKIVLIKKKSVYPQNRPCASAPHKSLISKPIYLKFCVSIIQSFGNKHTKIQWVWCKNDGFRTVNLGPVFSGHPVFYTKVRTNFLLNMTEPEFWISSHKKTFLLSDY